MKRSSERLLTTHTGSLPRPAALREADTDGYEEALRKAVDEVVRLQVQAGIDIVSDGEMSKPSYSTYITERTSGFGGQGAALSRQLDAEVFPEWGAQLAAAVAEALPTPACTLGARSGQPRTSPLLYTPRGQRHHHRRPPAHCRGPRGRSPMATRQRQLQRLRRISRPRGRAPHPDRGPRAHRESMSGRS